VLQGFGGKPEKKEPNWKTKHRLEDNFKMDVQEMGGGDLD
jgi:hypothetical protein